MVESHLHVRECFAFVGWYRDIDCTIPWNFDNDTVTGNTTLYAAWVEEDVSTPIELPDEENCNWWWLILVGVVLIMGLVVLFCSRKKCRYDSKNGSAGDTKKYKEKRP